MAAIGLNHLLICNQAQDLQISHYDENGIFIENIPIGGAAIPGDNVFAWDFAVKGTAIYAATPDFGPFPATTLVQEYSSITGTWVRDVITNLDATNPVQNPDGFTQSDLVVVRISIDSDGNIYGGVAQANAARVWKWNNAGVFQRTYDLNAAGVPANEHNTILINPINNNELVEGRNVINPGIWRYALSSETLTATLNVTNFEGFWRSDFHCSGKYYVILSHTSVRVYDPGWATFTDYTVTKPAGFTRLDIVRPTNNPDIVWMWGRIAPGQDYRIWLHQLSTNTILTGPIILGTTQVVQGTLVYYNYPCRMMNPFVTLIGAT